MNLDYVVASFADWLWGWPLISFVIAVGLIVFVYLSFVPFRYFTTSLKLVFAPAEKKVSTKAQMSPFQAFINTLGTNIGNGSIAGLAVGIAVGGPGIVFWMLVVGFLGMALRFSEVYLGSYFVGKGRVRRATGGPFVYLSKLPGGSVWPYVYGVLCFAFSLLGGNAMQANSIALGLARTGNVPFVVTAGGLFLFIGYGLLGGAQRILRISDKLVPFKVVLFVVSALIVLIYHIAALPAACMLILRAAFTPGAVWGGIAAFTVQAAMRNGAARSISANEAGVGTAALLFGATEGKDPVKDAILSMLGTFITTHVVGFLVTLTIIVSGVWNSGLSSTPLSIAAFETVFGDFGGWIVTIAAMSFGLSVIVSYAFVTRECWLFLTNGRWVGFYNVLYALTSIGGALMTVKLLWDAIDIVTGMLLILNLSAILYFLKLVKKGLNEYRQTHRG